MFFPKPLWKQLWICRNLTLSGCISRYALMSLYQTQENCHPSFEFSWVDYCSKSSTSPKYLSEDVLCDRWVDANDSKATGEEKKPLTCSNYLQILIYIYLRLLIIKLTCIYNPNFLCDTCHLHVEHGITLLPHTGL